MGSGCPVEDERRLVQELGKAMRVALYARVSTTDRDQDPETQLVHLRDYCQAQGWQVHQEYVDRACALDVAHRSAWRELLDDAARRRFKVVLVFKLDRAFRSVKHMHDTLAAWEALGIAFQSLREQFDTSTALGRLLLNLLASLAEFELELIQERVKAGMDRAARQGKRMGRPVVVDYIDQGLVLRLRGEGKSWQAIAAAHPCIKLPPRGRRVRPSIGSIRRVYEACQKGAGNSVSGVA